MEEKSMWKELLNRAGWLLIFLLATILYQIPLGVTAILTLNAVPLLQSGLIVAGISIVILALFIIGARKTQLASFNFSFFRAKDLARLGLSYLSLSVQIYLVPSYCNCQMRRQQLTSLRLTIWFRIVL